MIKSEDKAATTVRAVYSRGLLTVDSKMYFNFLAFIDARKKVKKLFRMFGTLFNVLIPDVRSHGDEIYFLEQTVDLQLWNASDVDRKTMKTKPMLNLKKDSNMFSTTLLFIIACKALLS